MKETRQAEYLSIARLHPFEGHPFKVQDNEEMDTLVESIQAGGILTPLIVRPLDGKENEYEVISGHRRLHAAIKAGMETVPAFITPMSRDAAAIALVDSNLHREHILPSEKAFAYKLKMDAMSRQGQRTDLTLSQVATKLDTAAEVGKAHGESRDKVFRYIRLTNLIPGILNMVDEGKIALTPAVELSYLTVEEQTDLLETMESEDCTPSLSQAIQMKQLSQQRVLDIDKIFDILRQPKANQAEKIRLDYSQIRRFFPKSFTPKDVQAAILRLVEEDYKRRQRQKDRDSR